MNKICGTGHKQPLHLPKVTVCCRAGTFGIVGLFSFENDNGKSITITAECYVAMLQNILLSQLETLGVDPNNPYFQQDGLTAHTARHSMHMVCKLYHMVISRFGDILKPACSLDIMVPDIFLWGYLKERIYTTCPHTTQDLKCFKMKLLSSTKTKISGIEF
jgi:hypothetical protein